MPTDGTATAAEPAGLPPARLLRLIWLASPALPVGGFSYSEGLEAAVESGRVSGEGPACEWLLDQLGLGQAQAELAAAADACRAWQRHDAGRAREINDWVRHSRETAELRLQAEQMGRSLVEWLRNDRASPEAQPDARIGQLAAFAPAPTWPVAFALAAMLADATPQEALLALGFGWAENMVQAAMKAVPLGQAAAQRILARLAAALPDAVAQALLLPPERWQAYLPMLAILSSQHETQYSRLFRS